MLSESDSKTRLLNFGVSKPSDLDESFEFLLTNPKEIKVLQPLDEQEAICWEEKKLNSVVTYKKKIVTEERKKKGWNLDVCNGFFDSKGNFIAERSTSMNNNQSHFAHLDTCPDQQMSNSENTSSNSAPDIFTKNSSFVFESHLGFERYKSNNKRSYQTNSDRPDTKSFFQRFRQQNPFAKPFYDIAQQKNGFTNDRAVLSKKLAEPKVETLWFLRIETDLKGPLSTSELVAEISTLHRSVKLKKITDKFFIECSKKTEIELESEYKMRKEQIELEKGQHIQDPSLSKQEDVETKKKTQPFTLTISDRLEKCQKTHRFLKRLKINLTLEEIFNIAKNKTKNELIDQLYIKTGIFERDLTIFVDCFLEEIGIQVVTDIDKDGFVINQKSNRS